MLPQLPSVNNPDRSTRPEEMGVTADTETMFENRLRPIHRQIEVLHGLDNAAGTRFGADDLFSFQQKDRQGGVLQYPRAFEPRRACADNNHIELVQCKI